jgi:heat-inducible transcriptional repressor
MKEVGLLLSDRQRLILRAIVDDYVQSAEPVGSRTISKREDVSFSPATIRNEMSDLEDMGFLEQPHTSAGRIPSQKGYRFYVDHLMEPHVFSQKDLTFLKDLLASRATEMEKAVQQTATLLSQMSNYTSILLGPQMPKETLRHLQLVPLSDYAVVMILVTSTGQVVNRTLTLPEGISSSDIEKLVNLLNYRLKGIPLSDLKARIRLELIRELQSHMEKFENIVTLIDQMFAAETEERLFFGGTTKILNQPEFKDVDKARDLLELFEKDHLLLQLLNVAGEDGIQIRIGQENGLDAVHHCSIITASYSLDGLHLGTVGIIGPTRMEYRKVIGLLNHVTIQLPSVFRHWLHLRDQ